MKANAKKHSPRAEQQRRPAPPTRRVPPAGNPSLETSAPAVWPRLIPSLAAAATLLAAIPPLLPGLGVRVTWSSALFGLAVAVVAVFVARTAASLYRPGHPVASAKAAGLLVLVVVVPVVFDPRTVDGFNLAKFTATLIAALAIVIAWAVESVTPSPAPRWRNGLHWPVLALMAWTAIATATSVSPRFSVLGAMNTNEGLLATAALVVIFFAVVQAIAVDQVKAVLSVLYLGAGGPTVLFGLIQLHDRLWPETPWEWIRQINGQGSQSFFGGSIFSTFANPNHLSGFLAVLVPVGLVLFLLHRSRPIRILIAAVMAGALVELLQATSWGALLATTVALVLVLALLRPEWQRRPKISLAVAGGAAGALILGAVGLAVVPQFSAKLSSGMHPGRSLTMRADIWTVGVALANDRPLVGHGPDTWIDRAAKYQDAEAVRRYGGLNYYSNGAHNLFVSQAVATGYPGVLLLLAVLAFATLRVVGAWRRLRQVESHGKAEDQSRARQARLCLVAVVAGLAAFLVQASFNLGQVGLSFVFWTFLGLLCVLSLGAGVPPSLRFRALVARPLHPTHLPASLDAHGPTGARRRHGRATERLNRTTGVVSVVACLALALATFFATRPLRADHNAAAWGYNLALARQAPSDEADRLTRQAATQLDKAIELNPWELSYRASRANRLFVRASSLPDGSPSQASLLRAARHDYQRVVELRPYNAEYLLQYAKILLKIQRTDPGDTEAGPEAMRFLRRAVNANPTLTANGQPLERVVPG